MKKLLLSCLSVALVSLCSAGTSHAQDFVFNGTLGAGQGAILEFSTTDITSPIYLDFSTNGSSFDTELGLFSGFGAGATFVDTDDDSGLGLASVLTFGAGSGLMLGDAFNLGGNGIAEGEDGNLAAGNYTLVVGGFNTTFGSTLGGTTFGSASGDYTINVYTNKAGFAVIPEPTSTLLMFVGFGIAAIRRRR